MSPQKPSSIEQYIAQAPPAAQKIMLELCSLIQATLPEAKGGISWNVPIYKYHGVLVGFSVATKHVSLGID